jgi:hypothetical protein
VANRIIVHRYWIYALIAVSGVIGGVIFAVATWGILSHLFGWA